MDAGEVLAVLDDLAAGGCRCWVAGGWGVDALAGAQTRPHRDLDLAVDAADEAVALRVLADRGYAVETDWRPVRVELVASGGRRVDLHPVRFDDVGNGVQADLDGGVFRYPADCFVTGTVSRREVGCLSVAQQLAFHSGYEPRDVDLADLAVLRDVQRREHDSPRPEQVGRGMRRVLVLGRGGAGKSTLAREVGALAGLPVHELDAHFWQQGLVAPDPEAWAQVQRRLAAEPAWVLDGDLGPSDVLAVRAARADTVVLLDHGVVVCAWRAARRGRERRDFWLWVWRYRRRHLPAVLRVLEAHAPSATVHRLRSPRATRAFLQGLRASGAGGPGGSA